MMYAVIVTGGKQYRVKEGQKLKLEKLEVEQNQSIDFDKILMIAEGDDIKVGSPYLAGFTVQAEVISHGRHDKIRIIKMKRRKHHMKRMGHRQSYTEVKIIRIQAA
jgi:large subunit ribosomal protein L21